MMKTYGYLIAPWLLLAACVAGCSQHGPAEIPGTEVASGPLLASIATDRRSAEVGQSVRVTLIVRNTSGDPIPVEAASTAPMFVSVWRYVAAEGWLRIKEYPEAVIARRQAWVLEGREEKSFSMTVPVEPDWPTRQLIKLTAELNGRTDARPYVLMEIRPRP